MGAGGQVTDSVLALRLGCRSCHNPKFSLDFGTHWHHSLNQNAGFHRQACLQNTVIMKLSSLMLLLSAYFLLSACQSEGSGRQPSEPGAKLPSKGPREHAGADWAAPVAHFPGVLAVGGRFSLGASAGQDYVSELRKRLPADLPLRNAAIKGEALGELLQRLPHLLAQQPRVIILELGEEDERQATAASAFERDLKRLSDALPGLQLIVLCTAMGERFRRLVHQFAEDQPASVLDFHPQNSDSKEVASELETLLLRTVAE